MRDGQTLKRRVWLERRNGLCLSEQAQSSPIGTKVLPTEVSGPNEGSVDL